MLALTYAVVFRFSTGFSNSHFYLRPIYTEHKRKRSKENDKHQRIFSFAQCEWALTSILVTLRLENANSCVGSQGMTSWLNDVMTEWRHETSNFLNLIITIPKRSCGKVIFSQVSVCPCLLHVLSRGYLWYQVSQGWSMFRGVGKSRGEGMYKGVLPPHQTWDTTGYGWQAGGTHPSGMLPWSIKCIKLSQTLMIARSMSRFSLASSLRHTNTYKNNTQQIVLRLQCEQTDSSDGIPEDRNHV